MFFEDVKLEKEVIFQEKRGDLEKHELHIHDVLEFHILLENEAKFQLAHKQYDGKPGDVFLFRPFEPHWNFVKHPNRPIRWISLLFSPSIVRFIPNGYRLLTPFYAVEAVSPLIPASSPCAKAIHQLASQAVEEQKMKPIGWEAKQFILFIDILLHTLRHTIECKPLDNGGSRNLGDHAIDQGIIQTIEYILSHFTEEIDVEQLVRMTGRQRTFFYRKFKAVTGITPNLFIHRLRMQVALYLLGNTNKSITEIGYECGYSSIHYFNKHFKDYQGMSPREYRKSVNLIDAP
ncbi:helix-turn-helix domain-containing protein [Ammoniphilus sp. YIM 78166]|uniref:AraC family transcriptional regulator n=1 Tax=Ammoniphilus sp. YIM 78166 TaxID=1644106 RepID=UPI00106F1F9A|nr:helix-turn-helix domain-containing protein [Ammoniphilus sp. YIM 78166]